MTDRNLILLGAAHAHTADHLRTAHDRGWRIAHVHDRDPDRRARLSARLNADGVADLAALPTTPARAALVCSETAHHAADITAALDAGLPVFTEKPLAGSAQTAEALAHHAATAGQFLHCNFFLRTDPGLKTVKSWLDAGAIGPVHHARLRIAHDGGIADWLDVTGWMNDPAKACYGGFADEAVHAIDLIHWLLGDIATGTAMTTGMSDPTLAVDDFGAALLRLDTGATAVVEGGWTDTKTRLDLLLTGAGGDIALTNGTASLTPRGAADPTRRVDLAPLDAGAGLIPFLAALDGDPHGLIPADDAARANAVLDALSLDLKAA